MLVRRPRPAPELPKGTPTAGTSFGFQPAVQYDPPPAAVEVGRRPALRSPPSQNPEATVPSARQRCARPAVQVGIVPVPVAGLAVSRRRQADGSGHRAAGAGREMAQRQAERPGRGQNQGGDTRGGDQHHHRQRCEQPCSRMSQAANAIRTLERPGHAGEPPPQLPQPLLRVGSAARGEGPSVERP